MSKYKDAGQKLEPFVAESVQRIYPHVHFDLDKFNGVPEMDEKIDIRGRVCGIRKDDNGGSVEVEVTDVCVPEKKEPVRPYISERSHPYLAVRIAKAKEEAAGKMDFNSYINLPTDQPRD